ncbi:unnamed protein product [Prunus brigantina]
MAQLRIKNPSVKYVAILEQLSVKSQLKAIDNMTEPIIKVTKCFVEYVELIQELPSHFYETKDDIPWELTNLADLLDKCHPIIGPHQDLDNVKYLRALISQNADTRPLEIGTSKSRFNLERLRGRQVLLLISDLSLSNEEIVILDHIYKERQNRAGVEYEILWLPVVDATTWDEAKRFRFEELKSKMPWYAVHDPLIIEPPVIKFIRNY